MRWNDAEAPPFERQTFDHIVCRFGVMHLSNADAATTAIEGQRWTGWRSYWRLDSRSLDAIVSLLTMRSKKRREIPRGSVCPAVP